MKNLFIPDGYESKLDRRQTQKAIKFVKDTFQIKLGEALNLERITAPIIVTKKSGINDDLNGVERKVHFTMKEISGEGEVVQSLAKWKRFALNEYGFAAGEGIFTDMNAVRRDDDVDNIHSIFVDQWDWERVITRKERTLSFLKEIVKKEVAAVADTKALLNEKYPQLQYEIDKNVAFITTQELEDMYPELSPKERENAFVKEHHTTFVMQIGGELKSGEKHDGRAPDYDDWSLNGDIIVWNEILGSAFEISSMGIRVDKDALVKQLTISNAIDRLQFDFHKGIVNETLPLTLGGGIGQSRICMLMLEKAHIGEVQVSIWPDDMKKEAREKGIDIL